jgi:hypothetical protein
MKLNEVYHLIIYCLNCIRRDQNSTYEGLKVHTDRTRFGKATRIFNFQWHLTSIFFYVFQIFGTTWAILAIWSAYLVKFLSVDGFICFWKLKIRVALPNRVRSVWALRISVSKRCSVLFLYLYLWSYGRFIAKYLKHIIALKEMSIINE